MWALELRRRSVGGARALARRRHGRGGAGAGQSCGTRWWIQPLGLSSAAQMRGGGDVGTVAALGQMAWRYMVAPDGLEKETEKKS